MKGEIDDAVDQGVLTPVSKLRVTDEDEDSYKKGFMFEKTERKVKARREKGAFLG